MNYKIIGLIIISLMSVVLISGCIDNKPAETTQTVEVQGYRFEIPSNYTLDNNMADANIVTSQYRNNDNVIAITVQKGYSPKSMDITMSPKMKKTTFNGVEGYFSDEYYPMFQFKHENDIIMYTLYYSFDYETVFNQIKFLG